MHPEILRHIEFFRGNDICPEAHPLFFNQQAQLVGQLLPCRRTRACNRHTNTSANWFLGLRLGTQPREIARINSAGSMARSPLRNERSGRWLGKCRITELAKLSNYQNQRAMGPGTKKRIYLVDAVHHPLHRNAAEQSRRSRILPVLRAENVIEITSVIAGGIVVVTNQGCVLPVKI